MSRNRQLALGLGLVAVTVGGCTVQVTEAQMKDRTQVAQIAQKVTTDQKNDAHVKRIALIGLSTPNQVHDSSGGFHMGGAVGQVIDTVESAKMMADKYKALACRALEASFDDFTKALTAEGFELVSPDEKLQSDKYRAMTQGGSGEWCYASRAPARLNIVDVFNWKKSFEIHQQLIDDLGVDGILMGQVGANDMKTGVGTLTLYVKGPKGYAVVGWSGRVKKSKFKFEAAQPGESDEAKLANAARVFTHSFELLSAKMGAEAK